MRRLAVAFAALGAVGCGHLEVHELLLRPPEPPAPRPAALYFVGRTPDRPYYDVALLQVVGYGDDANMEDVARALAVRAARLGCDAVVRVRIDQGWTRAHAFGVCARWSPAVPPPIQSVPSTPSQPGPLRAPTTT
jgi:hypothetical protein